MYSVRLSLNKLHTLSMELKKPEHVECILLALAEILCTLYRVDNNLKHTEFIYSACLS